MKTINKIYHAAIYVRLSKEDGDVSNTAKTESNSISNQKSLVREFLKNHKDIVIEKEYVDDGYSGSNFERPAFQMMLEDIKKGIIDCVCTKDLSRFGREYIDSGMYIERVFPALGVRFIAVNDHYDSLDSSNKSDEIVIPFKNLLNDAYCRDISVKIRSHLEIKRKQGQYIGNYVSYGYRKCDDDKHKIEIDAYAANIVKDIFRMKLQGMSQDAIACKLNENGILCPADYKKSEGSNYQTSFKIKDKSGWSSTTVRRILTNEIYIGNLVQGKHTTPNHKVKKMYVKDESEWVRIEKNHEAIVSERDFELVQRLLAMDTRTAPGNNEVYNLSGLVICADCGVPMVRKNSISGGRHYSYYMCATNKYSKNCSSHRISVNELDNAVLELLKVHISNILEIDKIIELIGIIPFQQIDMKKLEGRKKVLEFEVERCTELRSMLYSDMKEGVISKSDYIELHAAYENKRKDVQIAIHKIELEMESILEKNNDSFKWLEYFKENRNIKELTRSIAVSLIREIKVYDKKNIEVTFDFDNPYKTCLKNIENMGYKIDVDLSGKLNIEKEAV